MECLTCHAAVDASAKFCGACGANLRTACAACGAENPRAYHFCSACGAELEAGAVRAEGGDDTQEAERRVLTVLFCDLQGSTALSSALDPEEFAAVTASFQDLAAAAIRGEGGYVANFLGDGILGLFGYPRSHEDDACRAVRAALAIVAAVPQAVRTDGVDLAARAGADTGLVVVGRIGASGPAIDVAGETANVAARVQTLAEPGTVVVGDATRRLIEATFECQPLGQHELKGVSRPISVHRVVAHARPQRLESAGRMLTPLVGRAHERNVLAERWARVQKGGCEVVVLSGEPGIGKSRLLTWLSTQVGPAPSVVVRCSVDDQSSPLRPVVEELVLAAGILPGDSAEERVVKVEPLFADADAMDAVRPLLGATSVGVGRNPDRQRALVIEALWGWARRVADEGPGLVVVEDAHWADHSTLEWLERGVEDAATGAGLLMVVTARPEFSPPWPTYAFVTTIVLSRLDPDAAADLASRVAGAQQLSPGTIAEITARSEGVPLFVEELTRAVAEDPLHEAAVVPASLYESMSARLDRIGPVRRTAQLVALLGTEVPAALIVAVADRPREVTTAHLDELVAAGLLVRRGGPEGLYRFRHQLLREVARDAMLLARRREIHARAAEVLVSDFIDLAAEQPWVVADHFAGAGRREQAAQWWVAAANHAIGRSAALEAIGHYRRAVELLRDAAPSPERDREELGNLFSLSLLLMEAGDVRHLPEIAQRASALSDVLDDDTMRFQSHLIAHAYGSSRPDHQLSLESALNATALARSLSSRGRTISSLVGSCYARCYLGDTVGALADGLAAIDLAQGYSPERRKSVDATPLLTAQAFVAMSYWQLGRFDESVAMLVDTRARLREAEGAWRVAIASLHVAWVYRLAEDRDEVLAVLAQAEAHGIERGHRQLELHLRCLRSWAESAPGDPSYGALLSVTLAELASMGRMPQATSLFLDLGETELAAGRPAAARAAANRGLEFANGSGEHWLDPELHRLLAEVALLEGDVARARAAIDTGLAEAERIASRTQRLRLLATAVRGGVDDPPTRLAEILEGWDDHSGWAELVRARALL